MSIIQQKLDPLLFPLPQIIDGVSADAVKDFHTVTFPYDGPPCTLISGRVKAGVSASGADPTFDPEIGGVDVYNAPMSAGAGDDVFGSRSRQR